MKLTDQAGGYFSNLGGKILAGKKAREDAGRNRKRLDEAASASRELKLQRIANNEIKKILARLAYEADGYIAAARESEGAVYDAIALDALDSAMAAVNAWKKNENETAAGKYLNVGGTLGGVVIPGGSAGQSTGSTEIYDRTIGILQEALRIFVIQNSVRTTGDPDAALAALADYFLVKKS